MAQYALSRQLVFGITHKLLKVKIYKLNINSKNMPKPIIIRLSEDDDKGLDCFLKKQEPSINLEPCYKSVVFDERAKCEDFYITKKVLFYYDKSLERIRKNNHCGRHARPQELFSFLIDCFENKVHNFSTLDIMGSITRDAGEWLSCAFERQGKTLVVYIDPEGLIWKGNKYIKTLDFKFSDKKEFDIAKIQSKDRVKLSEFTNDFIEYFYTKKFEELPNGIKNSYIYLPPKNMVWPVARGHEYNDDYNDTTSVYCCQYNNYHYDYQTGYEYAASRGVVPIYAKV